MTEQRWRSCTMLCTTASVLLLLVGLGSCNEINSAKTDSVAGASEAAENTSNVSPPGDAERDRRQVNHLLQAYRPYGVLSPHTPTAFLTPFSIFAARPTLVASQVLNSQRLEVVPGPRRPSPFTTPFATRGKPSFHKASRNQLTKAPLRSSQAVYTPSRTPAVTQPFLGPASGLGPQVTQPFLGPGSGLGPQVTQPFLGPGSGLGPQVTPVPQHLRPLQPQPPTLSYGEIRQFPGPRECPDGMLCMPLVACAPCYQEVENQTQLYCSIFGAAAGVCCPEQPNRSNLRQLFTQPEINIPPLGFSNDIINEAGKAGFRALATKDLLDRELRARDIEVTEVTDPAFGHLQNFLTSPLAIKLGRDAFVNAMAGNHLLNRFRLSPLQAGYGLQQFELSNTVLSETCPQEPECRERDRFYRTVDGSCNNLDNPMSGQARTTFQRLRPPHYSDGLFRPRQSVLGGPLPSARLVSTSIAGDVDNPSPDYTLSLMQWGQFIDHDLVQTPINRLGNMSGIQCCSNNGRNVVSPPLLHPACLPIEVPANDPFFGESGRRCMNFVRSMFAPRANPCNLGYAEQMNQVTHHLDGSQIYGSSAQEQQQLRQFRGGLLNVQGRDLLPPDPDNILCQPARERNPCLRAGDNRVNQHISLTAIQTSFLRLHNRIARELARLNPDWSDETIYQETRRIVVAIYQHIIYNEFLPIILGKDYMAENGLLPRREGYSRDYDSNINAALLNEFTTVAFRFGHSLAQGMLQLVGKKGMSEGSVLLHDNFNNPRGVYGPGRLDGLLRGLATQPTQELDNSVSSSLTNRLFQTEAMPQGLDLVALNTQRGRDHGIAPYNELREACGLPRARTFEDLLDVIRPEVVRVLQQLYASVDDIDPFIAGISERRVPGAFLGPTFRCIVGEQFTRLKRSDRFFYDLGGMPTSFTEAQLNSIRMMSWARVLCETGDMLGYVQPLAFRLPRGLNERIPCDSPGIPGLDLTPWISDTNN
nr:peroxidase-like [Procambarus clarkii]